MDADSDVALDILITNVVCVFRTRCHLNLRKIALEGANVIYKRDVGVRDSAYINYLVLEMCLKLNILLPSTCVWWVEQSRIFFLYSACCRYLVINTLLVQKWEWWNVVSGDSTWWGEYWVQSMWWDLLDLRVCFASQNLMAVSRKYINTVSNVKSL